MATRTISTRLAIEGESEYKQSIANINNALKTLQSELALVESEYRNNANSMDALNAKSEVLNRLQVEQQKKVSETKSALENAQKAQQAYAQSAADYGVRITEVEKRLEGLTGKSRKSKEAQAELNARLEEYRQAQARALAGQEAAQKGVEQWQRKVNYAERDLNDLNGKIEENSRYLGECTEKTKYHATSIDEYGKAVKQAGEGMNESSQAVQSFAASLAAAGVQRGIREIADALKACIGASVEFESAITGVYKTVEGTPEQLDAIADGIKKMSTEIPATATEIAAVAEAAGQLGIATDDVLSFSRVMIDLGNSTNMGADEAATALARFANITGTSAADYERLGSVIVGLGNNFATTEAEITQMATRLASAGTLAGLSEAEIMALATAMSSVGIEAEAGGTAMTQTLTAIEKAVVKGGDGLNEFACIAGMSASEFAVAWETDAITAIQAFIGGLGRLDEQGESATLVLDELGLSGVRQSNMLKSLALASDTMTGAVSMANQAWVENTALAEEAGKRYETTGSKLTILKNSFDTLKVAVGDELKPVLNEIADAGSGALQVAAGFVEDNPLLVAGISGVAAGIVALTGSLAAASIVIEVIIPLLTALKTTLHTLTPFLAVAGAVTAIVTAFVAYSAAASDATTETKELTKSIQASREAFQETAKGIEESKDSTLDMAAALRSALAEEEKSAASKAVILGLVGQLNEAVPGLALAYDEERDSLNMTTEALRGLVEAEAERQQQEENFRRLVELRKQEMELERQLEVAAEALAAAKERQAESDTIVTETGYGYVGMVDYAARAVDEAQRNIDALTEEQEKNRLEATELEQQYNAYAASVKGATDKSGDLRNQTEDTTKSQEELAEANEALEQATKALIDAQDALTAALKEQEEKGSLSLDTTLALIDAGYAAALSIDTETGAVTLNKDAYIQMAQAKIEEQIQALETQRLSAISRVSMLNEAQAAVDAAVGYVEKARAEQLAERAARENQKSIAGELAAYDAQIAALKASKNAIGSYSGAVVSAARVSSSASAKVKTQAEKDLAAYKALKEALDHERALADKDDVEAERRYYADLERLREEYLTDTSNLGEYRKATEELHKFEVQQAKDAADEKARIEQERYDAYCKTVSDAEQAYKAGITAMAEASKEKLAEIQRAYDGLMAKQDAMSKKLQDYGDLFTTTDTGVELSDLNEQIEALRRYDETLSELKKSGISESLLNEVVGMGVDDAISYGEKLLEMDDQAWEEYNQAWEEKNRLAVETAEKFYRDQMDAVRGQYDTELKNALDELSNTTFQAGVNMVDGLTEGMKSKQQEAMQAARDLVAELESELRGMNLPGAKVDGSHAAGLSYVPYDGYLAELHKGERVLTADEAKAFIAASMPSRYDVPRQDTGQMAQLQSMMQTAFQNQSARQEDNRPIQLNVVMEMDGAVVARKQLTYNRREERLHGTSFVEGG